MHRRMVSGLLTPRARLFTRMRTWPGCCALRLLTLWARTLSSTCFLKMRKRHESFLPPKRRGAGLRFILDCVVLMAVPCGRMCSRLRCAMRPGVFLVLSVRSLCRAFRQNCRRRERRHVDGNAPSFYFATREANQDSVSFLGSLLSLFSGRVLNSRTHRTRMGGMVRRGGGSRWPVAANTRLQMAGCT